MERIESAVKNILIGGDGHGFDHVERVRRMAVEFARKEGADVYIVELAALLHDVDDYKLVGQKSAEELGNARAILSENEVDQKTSETVLEIIGSMGYSKLLEGIRPATLEGMIVSDADMCDAIGATGILRTHAYALSKGNEFFDKTLAPLDAEHSSEAYRSDKKSHSAQHFFDKLLLIPDVLMTQSGQAEGARRRAIMRDFLKRLFEEEESSDWLEHLARN